MLYFSFINFVVTRHLTNCTLLARWSASVLKVGVPCHHEGCEAYERRLAYTVTVRISAQNNFGRDNNISNNQSRDRCARECVFCY